MMKILYYCIVLLGNCLFSLSAQTAEDYRRYLELRQQELKISDNRGYWTVALSGGATLYQGESDGDVAIKELITPYGKLAVARWFSSVWGMRLQFDGGVQKNNAIKMREPDSTGNFYFADGYLGVITDVMNWGTYKRSNRPVSVLLYGGGGVAWTPSSQTKPSQISPGMLIGGQVNIRLTDTWSIAVELDGTIVKDNFNSHTGGRKYEGYTGVTAGLVYRIRSKNN